MGWPRRYGLHPGPRSAYPSTMQFDDLLRRYFATDDPGAITPGAMTAGIERMQVDCGLEKDRSRRFALWALMYMLGQAPDLERVFPDPADRDAARNFMDLSDRVQQPSEE